MQADGRWMKRKGWWKVPLSLLLLSGLIIALECIVYFSQSAGSALIRQAGIDLSGQSDGLREMAGFGNPVDDWYLPLLCAGQEADRSRILAEYEIEWKCQLEEYLEDYEEQCPYEEHKKMARDYLSAVQEAHDTQAALMEYAGMEEDIRLWYGAQLYHTAFVRNLQAEVDMQAFEQRRKDSAVLVSDREYRSLLKDMLLADTQEIYRQLGGFAEGFGESAGWQEETVQASQIQLSDRTRSVMTQSDKAQLSDVRIMEVLRESSRMSKEQIRDIQEDFDLSWCNELGQLTSALYETLDQQGKILAGEWQMGRERWKAAMMCELRYSSMQPNETGEIQQEDNAQTELLVDYGWINRFYCMVLQSVNEKWIDNSSFDKI